MTGSYAGKVSERWEHQTSSPEGPLCVQSLPLGTQASLPFQPPLVLEFYTPFSFEASGEKEFGCWAPSPSPSSSLSPPMTLSYRPRLVLKPEMRLHSPGFLPLPSAWEPLPHLSAPISLSSWKRPRWEIGRGCYGSSRLMGRTEETLSQPPPPQSPPKSCTPSL